MILSANIHGLEVPLVTLKSINMNKATVEIVSSWTAPGDYYSLGVRIINCTGISKTVWRVIMAFNDENHFFSQDFILGQSFKLFHDDIAFNPQ